MNVTQTIPILRTFDEAKTREFYIDFLGFEVEFEHRFAPDLPLYMGVRLGNLTLHLSEHHGDASPGARVFIYVDGGLTEWVVKLSAKEYKHARPGCPGRTDWGTLEVTLADPFGNRLTFAERVEG